MKHFGIDGDYYFFFSSFKKGWPFLLPRFCFPCFSQVFLWLCFACVSRVFLFPWVVFGVCVCVCFFFGACVRACLRACVRDTCGCFVASTTMHALLLFFAATDVLVPMTGANSARHHHGAARPHALDRRDTRGRNVRQADERQADEGQTRQIGRQADRLPRQQGWAPQQSLGCHCATNRRALPSRPRRL